MTSKDFKRDFSDALDQLEADAHAVGLNFTQICREIGISRATPDRWKRHTPKTIELLAKMQKVVEAKKLALATGIPGETV